MDKPSTRGYHSDLIVLQDPSPKPTPPKNSQGLSRFLLRPEDLVKNNYPLTPTPGFVESTPGGIHKGIIGMDCEMVVTSKGYEVARVSLVNSKEEVLYDEYILPNNPVIDYLTQYSGITPELLSKTSVTFDDVQAVLVEKINSEAVLCGHSLDNDLNGLKFIHRKVADTSVLYPNPIAAYKNGLKKLALKYLKKNIQNALDM